MASFLCLVMGCSESSQWDRQWEQMQTALSQGHLQQAQKMLQHMLPSIREKGPTDTRYALVIYQLGEISRLQGQETQAEAFYWKSLPLIAESMGPEHPRMADPLAALASLYRQKHQLNMAIPLLKRALAIREKSWGFSHPQLLSTLQDYHSFLLAADHTEEAREILNRIERIVQNTS